MFLWLSGLPVAASLPLVVVAFVLYGTGGFWLVRRVYNPHGKREPTDMAPFPVLAGAAAIFLLGFGIITIGAEQRTTRTEVLREANQLMTLHEHFASYPSDVRGNLDAALGDYLREIIDEEWPVLERGGTPKPDDAAALRLSSTLLRRAPPVLDSRFQNVLAQRFSDVEDLRHQRLARGGSAIPRSVWLALLAITMLSRDVEVICNHPCLAQSNFRCHDVAPITPSIR